MYFGFSNSFLELNLVRNKKYIFASLIALMMLAMPSATIPAANFFSATSSNTTTYEHNRVLSSSPTFRPDTITGTSPPNSGDWNISDATTIENENLIINGSIFIKSGGALILKNSIIKMKLSFDGEYWIEVLNGGNLTMIDSTITAYNHNNHYYIKVDSGSKFYMKGSTISYAGYSPSEKSGLWINTNDVIISDNSTIQNSFDGIYLYGVNSIIIANSTVSNNTYSNIQLQNCNNITIVNNTISNSHANPGVNVWGGRNITISNNTFFGNYWGVSVNSAINVTMYNNTISSISYGFYISYSDNITVVNCIVSSEYYYSRIWSSSNVTMKNNEFWESAIYVEGSDSDLKSIAIDESNTVNGRPVKYYFNVSNIDINGGTWGEYIFAYSENITISNVEITTVELYEINNVTISRSTIGNYSYYGVYGYHSNNVMISGSTISNSTHFGVSVMWSGNITISSNTIFNSNRDGLSFYHVSNATIFNNTIFDNHNGGCGVDVEYSNGITISNNTISHNSGTGVNIGSNNNMTVSNNTIFNNGASGISVSSGNNVTISNNTISNNYDLAYISLGSNFTMRNNEFLNDTIFVGGDKSDFETLLLDESNMINGRTVKYYFNVSNIDINGGT